ncbi:hypothetical protein Lrub_2839 [Legionella rubrilucens]|uniref:Proteolipid membrane potential modulator n=1 Tax=Legionella rubrilucens TaxID=458 RepID=A0A0W0XN43_9GAMM|nr:hypothetical protein [Legionella rubrilucens]KTD46042.1 hypothetical protein Lrub_2839 [Legionella rubrilucens]
MKRLFFFFLSMAFPWLVLLIKDNPGGAVMALIMQASIIGWIPAGLWAMRVLNESEKKTPSAR